MLLSTTHTRPRKSAYAASPRSHRLSDLWRKISIYVCIPALLIAGVNAYNLYTAHQEHVAHELANSADEDDATPEYPYQNIRVGPFVFNLRRQLC